MRCDPWMDHMPIKPKTRLERAQDNLTYREREMDRLHLAFRKSIDDFKEAVNEVDKAKKEQIK